MRTLLGLVFLLLIGLVGVGFYQGWFHFSTMSTDQTSSATITVDQDKLRADEGKAREKMEGFGQKTKGTTSERTGNPKEPERQP